MSDDPKRQSGEQDEVHAITRNLVEVLGEGNTEETWAECAARLIRERKALQERCGELERRVKVADDTAQEIYNKWAGRGEKIAALEGALRRVGAVLLKAQTGDAPEIIPWRGECFNIIGEMIPGWTIDQALAPGGDGGEGRDRQHLGKGELRAQIEDDVVRYGQHRDSFEKDKAWFDPEPDRPEGECPQPLPERCRQGNHEMYVKSDGSTFCRRCGYEGPTLPIHGTPQGKEDE